MKKLLLFACIAVLVACGAPKKKSSAEWSNTAPGVWTTSVGIPEKHTLLGASDAKPKMKALEKKTQQPFPLDTSKIKVTLRDGKTFLRFPLDREEQIYGLGLQFKSVGRRGQIMRLHMDHYGRSDDGRTHAPVPFFVSSKGYGVLFNSARYIDVWVGTGVRTDSDDPAVAQDRNTDPSWNPQPYSDNLEILVPADGVDIVMFAGDNMLDVVSRFNLYCGGGFIPPSGDSASGIAPLNYTATRKWPKRWQTSRPRTFRWM